ncbi:MAG: hypothetical protein ABI231_08760 [Candidatus Tumulicola sp.]
MQRSGLTVGRSRLGAPLRCCPAARALRFNRATRHRPPTGLAYGPDGSLFVGNEYVNARSGNVVVFPPGATNPARTIVTGINGGVLGVAVGSAL